MPKQLDLQELLEFQKEAYRHDYKVMCDVIELVRIDAPAHLIIARAKDTLSDNVASRAIEHALSHLGYYHDSIE